MRAFSLGILLTFSPTVALAAELTPERVAEIKRDEQKALDKVNESHGNKKYSQMSNAERRQVAKEQEAATKEVLAKHGVDAKEYARYSAKLSRDDQGRVKTAEKAIETREAKEKADRDTKAKSEQDKGVVIEHGIPVDLDKKKDDKKKDEVEIEHGIPVDLDKK
jgi:hypothetical protein